MEILGLKTIIKYMDEVNRIERTEERVREFENINYQSNNERK